MSAVDNTLNAFQDAEVMLGDICGEVASGGTLVALCADRGWKYRLVNRWIADDSARAERYKLALDIREQHAKDMIIAELTAYLKADITQAFDAEGNLLRMHDMPPEVKRLIAGIEFDEKFEMQGERGSKTRVHIGNVIKLKFWDKPRSIETFMKHLSMLVERHQVEGKLSLADLVAGAQAAPSKV